ncbi:hypothetical protein LSTR_LSTR008376 [Laodelphax striatellus]|uniref:Proteasome subunit beta n=1 Tax=Laodelphax striatellus TaxID=195883 RepID=A0A482XV33_LAOST|nr:hypothetical protein LSTR_LSTR008376 [Laodelphax striatellus]
MSILSYNGGALVAMTGKDCVAIASDKRFGVQLQTLTTNCQKIFEMGPHLYLGMTGLATDVKTVQSKLKFRQNLYELREGRIMSPEVFTNMMANMLYERRFGPYFIEPIVAGLEPKTFKPFISVMDVLGATSVCKDFAVQGTCINQLFGMCESLWQPDLEPDALFEIISQAIVNAFDRDAGSGWGAVVHVIEKDKVTIKHLKTRMD